MGHLAFLRLYYHNMTQELKVLFKTFIIKTVESDLEKSPLGQFGYLHSLNIITFIHFSLFLSLVWESIPIPELHYIISLI